MPQPSRNGTPVALKWLAISGMVRALVSIAVAKLPIRTLFSNMPLSAGSSVPAMEIKMAVQNPDENDAELDALTQEYAAWNKAQGLNLGSADEHLFDETLTGKQREWLQDFCRRWENASPVHTAQGVVRHRDL